MRPVVNGGGRIIEREDVRTKGTAGTEHLVTALGIGLIRVATINPVIEQGKECRECTEHWNARGSLHPAKKEGAIF